jgi:hypothetical protein
MGCLGGIPRDKASLFGTMIKSLGFGGPNLQTTDVFHQFTQNIPRKSPEHIATLPPKKKKQKEQQKIELQ